MDAQRGNRDVGVGWVGCDDAQFENERLLNLDRDPGRTRLPVRNSFRP